MGFWGFGVRQPLVRMVFDGCAPLVRRWNGYVPSSKSTQESVALGRGQDQDPPMRFSQRCAAMVSVIRAPEPSTDQYRD